MELTLQIKDQTKAAWLIQLLDELDFVEISDKSLKPNKLEKPTNPLLAIAGRFSSEPSNTSERVEEILMEDVDPVSGLSIH